MSQEEIKGLEAVGTEADHNTNVITADLAEKLDMVDNISHLASGFMNWHTEACNQMQHAIGMPEIHPTEGTHIAIKITVPVSEKYPEGERYLHPKEVQAFKAGIRYAYDLVAELPFKFVPVDADGNIHPDYKTQVVDMDAEAESTQAP